MKKHHILTILSIAFLLSASSVYAQLDTESAAETGAPADTSAPVISDVQSMSVGVNDETVMWNTDELATSVIRYGTSESLGQTAIVPGSAALMHSATLTDLAPGTLYHFCIDATDTSGNAAESCGHTFTTAEEPVPADTEPPVVTHISISSITTDAATIGWTTNEVATGYVEYGTTPDYGSVTPLSEDFATEHETALSGLSADITYYYRIVVADAAGNSSMTPRESFTTEAAPAPEPEPEPTATTTPESASTASSTPPTETTVLFSAVTAERISTSTVTILWETDVPTDSLIHYGDNATLGSESAHDTALVTTHEVTVSGLAPSTAYYFRIVARPSGAADAVSSELYDFATLAEPESIDPAADITNVSSSLITETGAHISWQTDELTAGSLEYGTTAAYGSTATGAASATEHSVPLSSLMSGTRYHYRVKAVDAGGNITYSLDHTFTTAPSSAPVTGEATTIAETSTTPAAATLVAPVSSGVGSGASGGTASPQPGKPLLIAASAGDSQIVFEWNNPSTIGFSGVTLVRRRGGYPASPSDGVVLYQGKSETFTDTELQNGTDYHYALYAYNGTGRTSVPLHITLAPVAGVEEIKLEKTAIRVADIAEEHFSEPLARGDSGVEVTHLQQLLNVAGVHQSGLTTGYFGPLTQLSVKKFQDLHNLPQTGITDAATRAKLNAISASHSTTGAPEAVALIKKDLSRGVSGEEVEYLQQFLVYEGSYPEALVTGYYGSLTQAAVARFQQTYGVTPAVGYVGPKTRHTIQAMLGF